MNTSVNNDDASIVGRELNGECVDREPQSPQSESIANWQLQEQPRYRLLHEGAEALANAELLALCLGSGVAGEDAVAMARRSLKHFGGIGALLSAPMPELLQCHGVGSAKASVIKAIQELSLRDVEHELTHADQFADSVSVSRFLRRRMGHEPRETFACLFLNARNQLISFEVLFRGSVDRAHVHAREVLRRGIEVNAVAVVLAHNHPSGSPEPSQADIQLTRRLAELLQQIDIRALDHIVVAAGACISFAQRGLL